MKLCFWQKMLDTSLKLLLDKNKGKEKKDKKDLISSLCLL